MAQLVSALVWQIQDASGDPISGAYVHWYVSGTTTDAPIYSDAALATPRTNPVVADSAGRLPNTYLNSSAVSYRAKIYDAGGVLLRDIDPVNAADGGLADGIVTTAKIAAGAVTVVKIADANVTNAKLADMAAATVKGRAFGAGTGVPVDLTGTQLAVITDAMTGAGGADGVKGLVPKPLIADATAKKYLRADGTWVAPVVFGAPQVIGSAKVTISGTTPTLVKGYNMTCTYGGATGKWDFALTVPAADANYTICPVGQKASANDALSCNLATGTTPTTGGFRLGFADNVANPQNPSEIQVTVFNS